MPRGVRARSSALVPNLEQLAWCQSRFSWHGTQSPQPYVMFPSWRGVHAALTAAPAQSSAVQQQEAGSIGECLSLFTLASWM